MFVKEKIDAFIARWSASSAHERRHKDMFFAELCDALGVERPDPKDKSGDYCFEKTVAVDTSDGRVSTIFLDFYRRGCFVCEAKQGSESGDLTIGTARRGTEGWKKAMRGAFGQAKIYAGLLPEGRPPFVITCDIGNCFEVWSGFRGDYGGYGARRTIELAQLADPNIHEFFFKVFTDPLDLDPARHAQKVTRVVAAKLASLALELEKAGRDPELTAQFLMRCLFTMFAEDVGLLPENLFTRAVEERWLPDPRRFPKEVEQLWRAMNDGLPFGFEAKLLRFNGGLFLHGHSIPMTADQLQLLLDAAKCDWSNVEPTIFGTLLERALDPVDRQKLGAHFTPREYIERLVRPAVIEPLRAEWEIAQAQARQIIEGDAVGAASAAIRHTIGAEAPPTAAIRDPIGAEAPPTAAIRHTIGAKAPPTAAIRHTIGAKAPPTTVLEPTLAQKKKAVAVIREFHSKLAHTRVLDPACGSGNFLYVCLDLFKQIEAEVVSELADLGMTQSAFEMEGVMVNPGQFLGIELNPRAREIADLVLWIGYLQWYRRIHGDLRPVEPVLREYKNIVSRDAVLAYDDRRPRLDEHGKPITTWDQRTYKTNPVTGKQVPDEDARVPVLDYVNARPAEWPESDYVVSNPPFIGDKMMRFALGDGYVETLRATYRSMGHSDLVMYWWDKAASLVRAGKLQRFGFITTNSLTQTFNRQVLERHLNAKDHPLVVAWAIPDHPWVDAGADVRIAMTVGTTAEGFAGQSALGLVTFEEREQFKEPQARRVEIGFRAVSRIHANLSAGADITSCEPLASNVGLSSFGMMLAGRGFVLEEEEYQRLLCGGRNAPVLKRLVNARDIVQKGRSIYVIDFFGLTAEEAARRYPEPFQRLMDTVKPERDNNRRKSLHDNWWLFGEKRPGLRKALRDLRRYIAVPETSKHIPFVMVDIDVLVEHGAIAFALDDAFFFSVMSGRFHHVWSLMVGATLEDRPRYRNNTCFDPFPFPDPPDELKARIRDLGERLDAHRKRVQAEHPDVTLTGMYNALERLREVTCDVRAATVRERFATDDGSDNAASQNRKPLPHGRGSVIAVSVIAGTDIATLTEKERAFHDKALIGLLKQIHDELDAAVAEAYGWPADLPDEEILTRLVTLNHERAEEEKRGVIRWLRPEFQNPTGRVQPTQSEINLPEAAPSSQASILPWPKGAAGQLKAIRDLLASRTGAWSLDEIAAAFKGARKIAIVSHLQTLADLGVLAVVGNGQEMRWAGNRA